MEEYERDTEDGTPPIGWPQSSQAQALSEKTHLWRVKARDREAKVKLARVRELALKLAEGVESLQGTSQHNDETPTFYDEVRRFEISLIESALLTSRGHQRRAADLLALNYTTLNSLIKRYGISCKSGDDLPGDLSN